MLLSRFYVPLIGGIIFLLLGSVCFAIKVVPPPEPMIVLNQVGYLPTLTKGATLINFQPFSDVEVVNKQDDSVVLRVQGDTNREDQQGWYYQELDFSELKQSGEYYLRSGTYRSANFSIKPQAYAAVTRLLLRSYYLQRCGTEIRDVETNLYHAQCHHEDGQYAHSDLLSKAGATVQASGGWHDAGDYGKYIASASVAVNRLLSLYLLAPERYPDSQLNIPESGNGVSDVLDEVRYELDWMLTMQRSDGAVYRKLSGKKWPSHVSPDADTQSRFVYGISSPETGKFAASMALAARAYQPVLPDLSARYLAAAQLAWTWLCTQPDQVVDYQVGDDSGSGPYVSSRFDFDENLQTDADDRLSAALELYLATGEAPYQQYILRYALDAEYTLYEWKDASSLALWDLLTFDHSEVFSAIRADIKAKLLARAEQLLANTERCVYGLANERLVWGSNKMNAEEAITLLHAWHYQQDERYLKAALRQIDYSLGRNPHNVSFVSGVGEHSVHPVHIWASAIGRTIPGLFVGGPNILAQDGIAPYDQGMMSYIDHPKAYSVNEYAVDYNTPLIGLLELLAIYQTSH